MVKIQPLVHPILLRIIERFPEYNDRARDLFRKNQSFNEICQDYKQCCTILLYWQQQDTKEAKQRTAEYEEILQGLDREIEQYLSEYIVQSRQGTKK